MSHICPRCKKDLTRLPWNSAGNILVCTNRWCCNYRQPVGWIKRYEDDGFLNYDSGYRPAFDTLTQSQIQY